MKRFLAGVGEVDLTAEEIALAQAEDAARQPTFEDRKADVRAQIADQTQAVFDGGFTVPSGTLAGKNLQVRNETDRTNWLTSLQMYSYAISQGQGAVVGAVFRTTNNETITTSFNEGASVIMQIALWGKAVYGRSWVLKDEVNAAQDGLALGLVESAIPFGWP